MKHLFYISTKGQVDLSSKATHFGLPQTYLKVFFSEITRPFELKFDMEYIRHEQSRVPLTSAMAALCDSSKPLQIQKGEHSGSMVECLTRDREAPGSSLTGVTALWSLSKTHLS